MSVVRTLLGNIKGPQGDTGAQGAQGAQGDAATISVGSVTTTAYGNPAQVTNSGTEGDAVFDFVIPQGKPGEATTKMGDLSLDAITTSTANFPSPQVGDTGKTAFGKIVKFFADTVAALAAKIDTSKIADNLTTNDASYVLSAKQGKALNDSLNNSGANYIKFPDGTMIQYGRIVFPASEVGTQTVAYTFPVSFVGSNPSVVASWNDTIHTLHYMDFVMASSVGLTSATFCANRLQANSAWYANYIAIGKWK